MNDDKTGRIVWHDLFTSDRQGAMTFYERVAGWTYQIEHATDFAWGGGAKDFVLALLGGEAGAGLAETPPELSNGWIAYVEVRDVDAITAHAEKLGGTIVRQPFEVPGVGRNALVRDPLGALFGICLSRHSFPAPCLQFGAEIYLSDAPTFLQAFYKSLFGWTVGSPQSEPDGGNAIAGPSGDIVAVHLSGRPANGDEAIWLPSLKVTNPEATLYEAKKLGAKSLRHTSSESGRLHHSLLCDPEGVRFGLLEAV